MVAQFNSYIFNGIHVGQDLTDALCTSANIISRKDDDSMQQ